MTLRAGVIVGVTPARFLEVISFAHASVLNVSSLAREAQVSRKTVEGYLDIVEDVLLAWRLSVFTRRAQRATAAHPKLSLFDAGGYRSQDRAGAGGGELPRGVGAKTAK